MKKNKIDVSEIEGCLGQVIKNHADKLNKLKTYSDIQEFIDSIYEELNDSAKQYVDETVREELNRNKNNFRKAYFYLYDIYLAGFSDSRISEE